VIKDLNDDEQSANKLVKLLDKIKAKVNLIYFNPYDGSDYQRPTPSKMEKFKELLNKKGVICTIRESKGIDISAACGQLREKK
jgi:23S rRNA (adenine2503-C2)-methyltransferase